MTTPVYLLQGFFKRREISNEGRVISNEAFSLSIERIGKALSGLPDSDSFLIRHFISGKKVKHTDLLSPTNFKHLEFENNKKLLVNQNEHKFANALTILEKFIGEDQNEHKGNRLAKPVLCIFTDYPDEHLLFGVVRFRLGCLLSKVILVHQSEIFGLSQLFDATIKHNEIDRGSEEEIRAHFSEGSAFDEDKEGVLHIDGMNRNYSFDPNSQLIGSGGEKAAVFKVIDGQNQLAMGLYRVEECIGSRRENRIKRVRHIIKVAERALQNNYVIAKSICWPKDIIDDNNGDVFHASQLETLQKKLRSESKLPENKVLGVIMPLIPNNFLYDKKGDGVPPSKTLHFMMCPEYRKEWAKGVLPSFRLRLKLCENLSSAVNLFEGQGVRHTDLSWKNVLADEGTGEIYVIDIDSCHQAEVSDLPAVEGTSFFRAPEIVAKGRHPTFQSDRFTLAKLIYGILMFDERDEDGPTSSRFFSGNLVKPNERDCMRFAGEKLILYLFFIKAFKIGWDDPSQRPLPSDWRKVLKQTSIIQITKQEGKSLRNLTRVLLETEEFKKHFSSEVDVNMKVGNRSVGEQYTFLVWAIKGGHTEFADLLITKGADVNAEVFAKGKSMTPLHFAAGGGHREIADLLITKGADVNPKDASEMTPLMLAAKVGHESIIELLIASGADVNARYSEMSELGMLGWASLHFAVERHHKKVAELLIASGADVNAASDDGLPLDIATSLGNKEMADILRKHGGKIS